MRHTAATVTVVTAAGAPPCGFTATSFTSVTLDPPLVSVCANRASSAWPTLAQAAHIGVNILAETQEDAARIFATSGIDRLSAGVRWEPAPHGSPLLVDALASMECAVHRRIDVGEHMLLLATPTQLSWRPGAPLLYHNGRYVGVSETVRDDA